MISSPRQPFVAYFVYGLAALFLCYALALQVSPSAMTQEFMRDLGGGAATFGGIVACYFYAYTLMQIPAGMIYDRYSFRLTITLALVMSVWGVLFFGVAHTQTMAAVGRFCMGIGSAFAYVGLLVVVVRWFSAQYFPILVGVAQSLVGIGAICGQLLLAFVVSSFGWRNGIQSIAIVGALMAVVAWLTVQDVPQANYETAQEQVKQGLSRVLKNSQTWWVGGYAFASWAPITIFAALWGVPYLMRMYNIDTKMATFGCAMIWLGIGIASPVLGWLSHRIQRRRIILSACAVLGFIISIIVLFVPVAYWQMLILLFCLGVAAAGLTLSFAVVYDNTPPEIMATAFGVNNMASVIGGAIFQPLVGYLLQHQWSGAIAQGVPVYTVNNYKNALIIMPLCFLLCLAISHFFIRETYCKRGLVG